MKEIGFVDPYINDPAEHCYNDFISHFSSQTLHHTPAKSGLESLFMHKNDTKAYFVAGSASNVTEPLEWHRPLADFLISELEKGKPVIAACFGHQLLCHAFGSEVVYDRPDQFKHLGVREVIISEDFWNFQKNETFTLAISHKQIVKTLGPDLIAVGFGMSNDVVIHRKLPLLSTQTHPEASLHFCGNDIKDISSIDEIKARKDGQEFIKRFLNYFNLL